MIDRQEVEKTDNNNGHKGEARSSIASASIKLNCLCFAIKPAAVSAPRDEWANCDLMKKMVITNTVALYYHHQ